MPAAQDGDAGGRQADALDQLAQQRDHPVARRRGGAGGCGRGGGATAPTGGLQAMVLERNAAMPGIALWVDTLAGAVI